MISKFVHLKNEIVTSALWKQSDDAGTYVMMSDIYKRSGKREEAAEMRMKMKERGLKKPPGCSWIPFGFQTHAFVVRDLSHSLLEALNWVVTVLATK